jgi:hypothetical protein
MDSETGCVMKRRAVLVAGLIAMAGFGGCGQTQIEPEHRELILQLATATSTRDPANLSLVEKEISRLTAASEMSEAQSHTFLSIVNLAKSGDWETARDRAYSLRDGQKPTASDLEAVAKRQLPEMIKPKDLRNRKKASSDAG